METGMFEPEEDVGKAQFQQELNRWFESRGIIADLRSHLRHLMIMALQNTQVGVKSVDRNSPKVQAYSLMIAEYLFRRGCHYTLSVFTSEVPSLVNFNPEGVLQGGRPSQTNRKRQLGNCFQEAEVEEIFNVLGMSSREVEFHLVKNKYLEKGCETSLIELFLQTVVEMATKLQVRRDVESHVTEGERLLSKKWSSRVVDILVNGKMSAGQVATMEEAIFRITENEIRRIIEVERRLRVKMLSEREKRIQEQINKQSDEMFSRLKEAENELATRKERIDEELAERERHLTEMALEWNNKHQEILHLSKNFHHIETENQNLQTKLKELEEENRNLKTQGERQTKTIDDLRGEMNSLMNKLKEATESNSALSEQIQALISRENKEALVQHDSANQEPAKVIPEEIPLLWLKNLPSCSDRQNKDISPKRKSRGFTLKNPQMPHPEYANNIRVGSGDAHVSASDVSEEEDLEVSLSSSSNEILVGVRDKLQNLEEQAKRLNQNYFEFKQKCASVSSDSASPASPSAKSPTSPTTQNVLILRETFCQTETVDKLLAETLADTYNKIQKLTETRERSECDAVATKKVEVTSPTKTHTRTPTKRQLQNRDFFLKTRELMQTLERKQMSGWQSSPTSMASASCSSGEDHSGSPRKKSPVKATHPKPSLPCSPEEVKKKSPTEKKPEESTPKTKTDAECLTLLQETRIRSPPMTARMPLRQQMLLSESEEEKEGGKSPKTAGGSPPTVSSEKTSFGKKSEGSR